MFPIDPRDLPGPVSANDASNCVVDNLVSTDAPGIGALFRWSLGDPFMKSCVALFSQLVLLLTSCRNLVVFHYGNLTHPSQDPPRIGFLSQVPANAAQLLQQAVQDAVENDGNFESTLVVAPTNDAELEPEVTVVATSASEQAAQLTGTHAPAVVTPAPTTVGRVAPTAKAGGAASAPDSVPSTKSNGNTNAKNKPNAARRLGVWDPWLLALGAVALSIVL
jgi:hypothetical protein